MSERRTLKVLVFEPEHVGHQPAYVFALASWLQRNALPMEVTFVVGRPLLERLRAEDSFDLERSAAVQVSVLSDEETSRCTHGGMVRKAMARWSIVCNRLEATGARHAHMLFLDPLQLPLALQRRPPRGATLSGILFRPSVHDIYAQSGPSSPAERVRDRRKLLLYRMMLRNPALTDVLSLDPYFPQFAAAEFSSGHKVRALPDPAVTVPAVTGKSDVGADLRESVHGRSVVFTLFGALTERKGGLQVLDALARLPATARAETRVVLAGRIDPAIASEIARRMQGLGDEQGAAGCIRVVDRYLTTPELDWLVQQSSVILAPYQRFVGSSGVLGWAAAARKPVIAQDYGLVGALVRDYRLGLAVDTSDPARIAGAISHLMQPGQLEAAAGAARWEAFLTDRRPDAFAAIVFDRLLATAGRKP
jgi:glycosyltransferase involved in cell wall biosynthesis